MTKEELIAYHKWLTQDDEHKENIGYEDCADLYLAIKSSAQRENSNVSDNVDEKKKCHLYDHPVNLELSCIAKDCDDKCPYYK